MKFMQQQNKSIKPYQEYENDSHIGRKRKAIANAFQKKNLNDIVELINDDEDEESAKKYAHFIR